MPYRNPTNWFRLAMLLWQAWPVLKPIVVEAVELIRRLGKQQAAIVVTDAVHKEVVKVRETHDPFPRDIRDAAGQ